MFCVAYWLCLNRLKISSFSNHNFSTFPFMCLKNKILDYKTSLITSTFVANQLGWHIVFRDGGLHFDPCCKIFFERVFFFSILIWPNVTRSCMSSSICKLFNRTLGDNGILCFNFSETFLIALFNLTFVADYFVFFDIICNFIVWAPKAAQLMGVPFDWVTIALTNVNDSCLLHIFSFLVTLQYNSAMFPTNSLYGWLSYAQKTHLSLRYQR